MLRADDVNHANAARSGRAGHRQDGARRKDARPRREAEAAAENERMAKLYREQILKEKPAPADLVQMIAPAPKAETAADKEEAVGSFGD